MVKLALLKDLIPNGRARGGSVETSGETVSRISGGCHGTWNK